MNKWLLLLILFGLLAFRPVVLAQAQNSQPIPEDQYAIARVEQVLEQGTTETSGASQPYQKLLVKILTGPDKGQTVEIDHGLVIGIYQNQVAKAGEKLVMVKNMSTTETRYYVSDKYRLPPIAWTLALFLGLVIFLGRWRGLSSIIGLGLSILILAGYVIPAIISGSSPISASIIGAGGIIFLSLYLSHGFNKRTHVAVTSTVLTLAIVAGLATLITHLAFLSGTGSEEAFYLQLGSLGEINLRGLLLGGMIIGALGVLDDITTSQAAAVEELSEANVSLSVADLYHRGLSIGTEHIASLTNTLALAYVGASFPLLLLFSTSLAQPLWVILNSERVAEEIVRTLVGSSALVLAVPIVTYLAAYVFAYDHRRGQKRLTHHGHHHHH